MGGIRLFQNGCSQSTRFPVPLDKDNEDPGNEIVLIRFQSFALAFKSCLFYPPITSEDVC